MNNQILIGLLMLGGFGGLLAMKKIQNVKASNDGDYYNALSSKGYWATSGSRERAGVASMIDVYVTITKSQRENKSNADALSMAINNVNNFLAGEPYTLKPKIAWLDTDVITPIDNTIVLCCIPSMDLSGLATGWSSVEYNAENNQKLMGVVKPIKNVISRVSDNLKFDQIVQVASHELFHALGIGGGHDPKDGNIMSANSGSRFFTKRDSTTLRKITDFVKNNS